MHKYLRIILIILGIASVAYIIFSLTARPAARTVLEPKTQEPVPEETMEPAQEGSERYQIDQEKSEASFTIKEVLRGEPKTVVGTTNLVSGNIELNFEDPEKTTIGVISVDAASLKTDSGNKRRHD